MFRGIQNLMLQRILKMIWTSKLTNEVLQKSGEKRKLIKDILNCKLYYYDYILRNSKYKIPQFTIKGMIKGKRVRGRPKRRWNDDLKEWTDLNTDKIIHKTRNRVLCFLLIINLPM